MLGTCPYRALPLGAASAAAEPPINRNQFKPEQPTAVSPHPYSSNSGPPRGEARLRGGTTLDNALGLLRADAAWEPAVARLRELKQSGGAQAEAAAADYVGVYAGRRGAMIIDVVASRQRSYGKRVRPMVAAWVAAHQEPTITALAENRLDAAQYGLSEAEVETIATAAQRFREFGEAEGLAATADEDQLCLRWAERYGPFEHAPRLDPVVGSVKGIGLALWSYMRMRSGANTLKVDVRVRKALKQLGFSVPHDSDHAVLIIAKAAAEEAGLPLLVLDQLLWSAQELHQIISEGEIA